MSPVGPRPLNPQGLTDLTCSVVDEPSGPQRPTGFPVWRPSCSPGTCGFFDALGLYGEDLFG
ncbi:hypothetical protein EYF80_015175 [Liparis tanakae]|uniref:Uncharacterized protein n=1 Tax=Liparis tanakae TaxID=230148 RepID=A0A4Z2I9I2_9TELE|nr:hypothetical protein EYF80_015175 [Liparis tanakae]